MSVFSGKKQVPSLGNLACKHGAFAERYGRTDNIMLISIDAKIQKCSEIHVSSLIAGPPIRN